MGIKIMFEHTLIQCNCIQILSLKHLERNHNILHCHTPHDPSLYTSMQISSQPGAYEPPKAAKERATRDHSWVPSKYNQIHSCQLKTSLLGSFCALLNMRDVR